MGLQLWKGYGSGAVLKELVMSLKSEGDSAHVSSMVVNHDEYIAHT